MKKIFFIFVTACIIQPSYGMNEAGEIELGSAETFDARPANVDDEHPPLSQPVAHAYSHISTGRLETALKNGLEALNNTIKNKPLGGGYTRNYSSLSGSLCLSGIIIWMGFQLNNAVQNIHPSCSCSCPAPISGDHPTPRPTPLMMNTTSMGNSTTAPLQMNSTHFTNITEMLAHDTAPSDMPKLD